MMTQAKQKVSMVRRRVLIAGGTGALAPALGFAASMAVAKPATDARLASMPGDQIVLSGRVENAQSKPLSGTTIEVRGDSTAMATTDGDGRFVLTINAPANLDHVVVKVGGTQIKRLELQHAIARLTRDGADVLRAAVAISIA
jgi:hypothetical protein